MVLNQFSSHEFEQLRYFEEQCRHLTRKAITRLIYSQIWKTSKFELKHQNIDNNKTKSISKIFFFLYSNKYGSSFMGQPVYQHLQSFLRENKLKL